MSATRKLALVALAAALIATPMATAATGGTANLVTSILNVDGVLVKITSLESAGLGSADDGKILAQTGAGVTNVVFTLTAFDRNGEFDLSNDQYVRVTFFGPDVDGSAQTATVLDGAADKVAVTMCTGAGGMSALASGISTGDFPTDATPLDGIKSCQITAAFNDGGVSSRPGEYTMQVEMVRHTGDLVLQTQSVKTIVYDFLDALVRVVDNVDGTPTGGSNIVFAGGTPVGGGLQSAVNRLEVRNLATSNFGVSMTLLPLTTATAGSVTSISPDSVRVRQGTIGTAPSGTATGGSGNNVADATDATGTAVSGGAFSATGMIAESQEVRFSFYLGDITTGGQGNEILQDGTYSGLITVILGVDSGSSPYTFDGTDYSPEVTNGFDEFLSLNEDGLGAVVGA